MGRPTMTKEINDPLDMPDYDTMRRMVAEMRGFVRSDGEIPSAEVWHDDVEWVFTGNALIRFLYHVKDHQMELINGLFGLIDYVIETEDVEPSYYVRDALVARAREVLEKVGGKR